MVARCVTQKEPRLPSTVPSMRSMATYAAELGIVVRALVMCTTLVGLERAVELLVEARAAQRDAVTLVERRLALHRDVERS